MQDERKLYEDIMSQNFAVGTFFNPTRYLMLYGMLSQGKLKQTYSKIDLVNYIFAAYYSNKNLSSHHPKIEVRKIPFFGIDVIYKELDDALFEWVHDARNNILSYDLKNIYLDILEDDGHISAYIEKILKVMFFKNFKSDYKEIESVNVETLMNDKNLECFGKSNYRNLVFADMQYCVLCDDCDFDNLYAVHILNSQETNSIENLSDRYNGLIMCKNHAQQFNNKEILLDDRGRFLFLNKGNQSNMRLSSKIYQTRKKYIVLKRTK